MGKVHGLHLYNSPILRIKHWGVYRKLVPLLTSAAARSLSVQVDPGRPNIEQVYNAEQTNLIHN